MAVLRVRRNFIYSELILWFTYNEINIQSSSILCSTPIKRAVCEERQNEPAVNEADSIHAWGSPPASLTISPREANLSCRSPIQHSKAEPAGQIKSYCRPVKHIIKASSLGFMAIIDYLRRVSQVSAGHCRWLINRRSCISAPKWPCSLFTRSCRNRWQDAYSKII